MHDIIPSIGKFKYVTTIDLIMGYYSMLLDEKAKKMRDYVHLASTIILSFPWDSPSQQT